MSIKKYYTLWWQIAVRNDMKYFLLTTWLPTITTVGVSAAFHYDGNERKCEKNEWMRAVVVILLWHIMRIRIIAFLCLSKVTCDVVVNVILFLLLFNYRLHACSRHIIVCVMWKWWWKMWYLVRARWKISEVKFINGIKSEQSL
jgi:hypothetical protein